MSQAPSPPENIVLPGCGQRSSYLWEFDPSFVYEDDDEADIIEECKKLNSSEGTPPAAHCGRYVDLLEFFEKFKSYTPIDESSSKVSAWGPQELTRIENLIDALKSNQLNKNSEIEKFIEVNGVWRGDSFSCDQLKIVQAQKNNKSILKGFEVNKDNYYALAPSALEFVSTLARFATAAGRHEMSRLQGVTRFRLRPKGIIDVVKPTGAADDGDNTTGGKTNNNKKRRMNDHDDEDDGNEVDSSAFSSPEEIVPYKTSPVIKKVTKKRVNNKTTKKCNSGRSDSSTTDTDSSSSITSSSLSSPSSSSASTVHFFTSDAMTTTAV